MRRTGKIVSDVSDVSGSSEIGGAPDSEKQCPMCPMCPKSTGATWAVGGVAFSFQRPGREYGTVLKGAGPIVVYGAKGIESADWIEGLHYRRRTMPS